MRDERVMRRTHWLAVGRALLAAGIVFLHPARADFSGITPDGKRILLKDNGTWQYVEPADKAATESKTQDRGEAVLTLERKIERGGNCRFAVRLVNNFPYEIRSLVPYYAAYRADGVIYDTVSSGSSFAAMKPGDALSREFEFVGIPCRDIARVQVVGGDRCDMGELDKFSSAKGACLARVRVVASDIVRFDK